MPCLYSCLHADLYSPRPCLREHLQLNYEGFGVRVFGFGFWVQAHTHTHPCLRGHSHLKSRCTARAVGGAERRREGGRWGGEAERRRAVGGAERTDLHQGFSVIP